MNHTMTTSINLLKENMIDTDIYIYIYILYFSYYLLVVEKDTENNSPHVGCENR
jgi:hypothetical protein